MFIHLIKKRCKHQLDYKIELHLYLLFWNSYVVCMLLKNMFDEYVAVGG